MNPRRIVPPLTSGIVDPATLPHPGTVLKKILKDNRISQRKFAEHVKLDYKIVNDVLNARRDMDVEFALRTNAATGISPTQLIFMQCDIDVMRAKNDKELMARLVKVREACRQAKKKNPRAKWL